ncbi:putative Zinc-type alcohol dehydrogenase-like protein C2E1P3.01 [Glarea lozoyensis 74030]|uniref:Putative Zinc-type alcohol dehydrogenase-like protein C2E1P3.01 n=1 Tax=Glarea lozoyensis (strain ATCC 74030 / MF5533) TaxID=1104152 RepID=H0EK88_GLAL7|nr:putative Zinc-type alcohol dehydrogenase-like protein C2E1P3.01 [Glarea lozoyensis 74030]
MLVTLLPADEFPRKDVNVQVVLAYTTFGEAFSKFGTDFPAIEEHYKFGVMFWKMAGELLAEGKFKPHPAIIMEGGLQGVPAGIAKVSHGTISAAKPF